MFCAYQVNLIQYLLIILKNEYTSVFFNDSSYVVDYFVYLCVQIEDICK